MEISITQSMLIHFLRETVIANDCQRSSGGAFIPAMLFPEKDVVISGEARYFESK